MKIFLLLCRKIFVRFYYFQRSLFYVRDCHNVVFRCDYDSDTALFDGESIKLPERIAKVRALLNVIAILVDGSKCSFFKFVPSWNRNSRFITGYLFCNCEAETESVSHYFIQYSYGTDAKEVFKHFLFANTSSKALLLTFFQLKVRGPSLRTVTEIKYSYALILRQKL